MAHMLRLALFALCALLPAASPVSADSLEIGLDSERLARQAAVALQFGKDFAVDVVHRRIFYVRFDNFRINILIYYSISKRKQK